MNIVLHALDPQPVRRLLQVLLLAICALLFARNAAHAAADPGSWTRVLDAADRYVERAVGPADLTDQFRQLLRRVRDEAVATRTEALATIASTEPLLAALGPVPKDGEPAEAPEIAAQRKQYQSEIANQKARIAQADLAIARANDLDGALSSQARRRLVDRLLQPLPAPWRPAVLVRGLGDLAQGLGRLAAAPVDWLAGIPPEQRGAVWLVPLAGLAVALVAGWVVRRLLLARFGPDPRVPAPSYGRRVLAAVAEGIADGILPAALLGAAVWWLDQPDILVTGLFRDLLRAALLAALVGIGGIALSRALLAPDYAAWRVIALGRENARILARRLVVLYAVFALDFFADQVDAPLGLNSEGVAVWALLLGLAEAAVTLSIVRMWLWRRAAGGTPDPAAAAAAPSPEQPESPPWFWVTMRRVLAAAVVLSAIATALGYVELGRFVVSRLLLTAFVLAVLGLVRGVLHEGLGALLRSPKVRARFAFDPDRAAIVAFWLLALVDPLLVIAAVFALAPPWGVPIEDLLRWMRHVLTGFTIGNVTVSLTDIVLALVVFVAMLAGTRLLQRRLLDRVLPQTRLDMSVQQSLSTGLGYLGVVLASALAISALGISLTNVALVAGALSVGIGFGLQSIVNNFVSGLILLVERPVKVGDWVVVGQNEGFVRRINVRATELETFRRAAVIIPNGELLTSAVTNWTHKDRNGRIEIKVGVAYGSDTEQVRTVLLECARSHPEVLAMPAPIVLFQDFAASSLDFELRCFCGDVVRRGFIASDLRFEIDRRFRREAIEIPYPHTVMVWQGDNAPAREPPLQGP